MKLFVLTLMAGLAAMPIAWAQTLDGAQGAPLPLTGAVPQDQDDDGPEPDRPNGVFHGNYCGIGDNGPGLPPTDALDTACMHHDACTPSGGVPSCGCNARFASEVRAVGRDRRQPDDLRALASIVEDSVGFIPCH